MQSTLADSPVMSDKHSDVSTPSSAGKVPLHGWPTHVGMPPDTRTNPEDVHETNPFVEVDVAS